jgi:hypothetical protein
MIVTGISFLGTYSGWKEREKVSFCISVNEFKNIRVLAVVLSCLQWSLPWHRFNSHLKDLLHIHVPSFYMFSPTRIQRFDKSNFLKTPIYSETAIEKKPKSSILSVSLFPFHFRCNTVNQILSLHSLLKGC